MVSEWFGGYGSTTDQSEGNFIGCCAGKLPCSMQGLHASKKPPHHAALSCLSHLLPHLFLLAEAHLLMSAGTDAHKAQPLDPENRKSIYGKQKSNLALPLREEKVERFQKF